MSRLGRYPSGISNTAMGDGGDDVDEETMSLERDPLVSDTAASIHSEPARHRAGRKPIKNLTLLNSLALVISLQIGSGIFSAPSIVSTHTPSPGAALLVWLISGLIVWTGASSFIELGTAIPINGGVQEYLRACYGDSAGFLFAWTWISIIKPCSVGVISMIFAEHVVNVIIPGGGLLVNKGMALVGVWGVTVVNCAGTHTGASVANGFLVMKLFAITSIVVIGAVVGLRGDGEGVGKNALGWFEVVDIPKPSIHRRGAEPDDLWTSFGGYVTAVFAALYCYGGWESIGFVVGEMKRPSRDLPRAMNTAMTIVITGFFLMNAALYIVLPMSSIRTHDTVVVLFGAATLGQPGRLLYTLIVSLSALGSLNANVFATGRLVHAAGRRGYVPEVLGGGEGRPENEEKDIRRVLGGCSWLPRRFIEGCVWFARVTAELRWEKGVPVYAMILNALFASFYIASGTFSALITFVGISEFLFFFFTVLGIFRLRTIARANNADSKESSAITSSRSSPFSSLSSSRSSSPCFSTPSDSGDDHNAKIHRHRRGYRTWTLNPLIFCLVSMCLVVRGVIEEPAQGLAIAGFVACGIGAWRWKMRSGGKGEKELGLDV
ncbi:MAG: Y+L amino acid transporter [Trichoglossum hirsutum]|nr:MAG: Y+L amino acid transporter [Trichoglossum hirsutum]